MKIEAQRMEASRDELIDRLSRLCAEDGVVEIAPGLFCARASQTTQPLHGVYSPSVCVIVQGAKEVLLGEERLRYDPNHCLLGSLDVPIVSQVVEASAEKPYLSLKLNLDPALIASVSVESGIAPARSDTSVRSMAVSQLHPDLLDAFVRFVRLLDNPTDLRVVSPLVTREIIYRLLVSEQGPRLRQMALFGGHANRIAKAVETLRSRFSETLRIEDLAQELGMSVSSFHQHFKAVTSMSPLQFQKQLRLQEARRLLLTDGLDASSAAVRVGYDDASQFSREYKRLFGEPPIRDVQRYKQSVVASV